MKSVNKPLNGRVVLVTGASSGIGQATASLLAANGYRVYGLSRREITSGENLTGKVADVTNPEKVHQVVGEIHREAGRIDVLVNCAGMGVSGSLEATPGPFAREQFEVNFWGTVHLCRTVLPVMRDQNFGMIINVSSIGGITGLPFQGYYSASKFAVEGFTESLRYEVAKWGIRVYLLEPGDLFTGFTAARKKAHDEPEPYRDQYLKTMQIIEKDETGGKPPGLAARKILRIIRKRPARLRIVASDPVEALVPGLKKWLPWPLFARILSSHYGL